MRRMISDVMQRQIKNLFESVQTDTNDIIRYVDDTGTEKRTTLGTFGTFTYNDQTSRSGY